jgi:V/A-type H+-transporting ATPase subunit B
LVSVGALSGTDRQYLDFAEAFERDFVDQRPDERRELTETLDRAWRTIAVLPRRELAMLPAGLLDRYAPASDSGDQRHA